MIRDINGLDPTGGDAININTTQVLNVRANEAADAKERLIELLTRKFALGEPNSADGTASVS